ncbi:MAG: hypothetical protein JJU02_02040 [Cryomorphaceae bacterium]|nr:hypothetical protein [Cryomorphaceae bacterium]
MELMFNELSVVPYSANKYEAIERMTLLAKTFKKARDFGFKRIRSDVSVSEIRLADNYTVHSWLIDSAVSPELKGFMFGSIITPFINEEDGQVEEAYIEAEYFYVKNEIEKIPCLGLAAAHLYELPSISLNTCDEWQRNLLPIIVAKDDKSEDYQIPNVFDETCFAEAGIIAFVENLDEVELLETTLNPNEKDIHLADHHGKNELKALCDRLKQNEYVVAMRSTYWGGNTFVRKIHKNGVVEITLIKSQRKYALLVQTTGRNYRETEAIANKLRDRYS